MAGLCDQVVIVVPLRESQSLPSGLACAIARACHDVRLLVDTSDAALALDSRLLRRMLFLNPHVDAAALKFVQMKGFDPSAPPSDKVEGIARSVAVLCVALTLQPCLASLAGHGCGRLR